MFPYLDRKHLNHIFTARKKKRHYPSQKRQFQQFRNAALSHDGCSFQIASFAPSLWINLWQPGREDLGTLLPWLFQAPAGCWVCAPHPAWDASSGSHSYPSFHFFPHSAAKTCMVPIYREDKALVFKERAFSTLSPQPKYFPSVEKWHFAPTAPQYLSSMAPSQLCSKASPANPITQESLSVPQLHGTIPSSPHQSGAVAINVSHSYISYLHNWSSTRDWSPKGGVSSASHPDTKLPHPVLIPCYLHPPWDSELSI